MSKKVIIAIVVVVLIGGGATFGIAYFVAKNLQSNKNAISPVVPTTNMAPETNKPNGANPSLPVTETLPKSEPISDGVACPADMKLCPDGSYVSRDPSNCVFKACPVIQTPVAQAKTYNINIASFAFSPNSITINKGDTVVWTNNDSAPHNIAGSGLASSNLGNGQSYSFKFNTAGTYSYICSIHPSMKGSIIVK